MKFLNTFGLSKAFFCLLAFLCLGLTSNAQKINFNLSTDKDLLRPGNSELEFEYNLTNNSNDIFSKVEFASDFYVWRTNVLESDLSQDLAQYDPNANGLLEPGETWTLRLYQDVFANIAETYVINGGVRVESNQGEVLTAGDAEIIHIYGVNMDVNILNECVGPGDKMDITLTTRLLIDEDAAKTPGTTTITVGGIEIEIALPASQWEARDLIVSADGLNGGVEFDPFDPPAGLMLTNFCEQGGIDAGRNDQNVLDECESIETVRAPCMEMGEDDILCEFADWQFCYCLQVPLDGDEYIQFQDDFGTISATDNFSVWKADENPAGSGNYGDFIDVSDQIETGGADSDSPLFKIIPVTLVNFNVAKEGNAVQVSWETETEINNKYFEVLRSFDGDSYEKIARVEGAGNSTSTKEYNYMDKSPALGMNYYQLMQVDFDGSIDYSSVEQINLDYRSGSASINLLPNPATNFIRVESKEIIGTMSMIVFDEKGSVVKESKLNQGTSLDVSDIPNGVYFVKVYDLYNYEIGSQRIFIAR